MRLHALMRQKRRKKCDGEDLGQKIFPNNSQSLVVFDFPQQKAPTWLDMFLIRSYFLPSCSKLRSSGTSHQVPGARALRR